MSTGSSCPINTKRNMHLFHFPHTRGRSPWNNSFFSLKQQSWLTDRPGAARLWTHRQSSPSTSSAHTCKAMPNSLIQNTSTLASQNVLAPTISDKESLWFMHRLETVNGFKHKRSKMTTLKSTGDGSMKGFWTITNLNWVVIACWYQNVTRGMPGHHLHILGMTIEHWDALKLMAWQHLPYPHRFIPTAWSQKWTWWIPCHTLHLILVTLPKTQNHSIVTISLSQAICICIRLQRETPPK